MFGGLEGATMVLFRWLGTVVFLAVALVSAADDQPVKPSPAALAEMKKMEGTWTVETFVVDGDGSLRVTDRDKMRLVVKGDTRTAYRGDEVAAKATYRIDPASDPKTIDITITEGPDAAKGRTLIGINELAGDRFTVCLARAGFARPKKLAAAEGTYFQVYKRSKTREK